MKYRRFPKLPDMPISQFGFGIMRMPTVENSKDIDRKLGSEMIDAAIEGGVNYFDTAYNYHEGDSEKFVADHLVAKLKKHNLHLATKLPQWKVKETKDYDAFLDEQLKTLGLHQIEFYLMHSIHDSHWENHKTLGMIEFIKRAVSDGRIKYPCFSYHGTLDTFKEIIDAYDGWIMAQIMLNYIDENWQAGVEGMRYAYARDVGIAVMEPLKGGLLVNKLPDKTKKAFERENISPVTAAMNWCYDFKEPTVVLSGVSTLEHTLGQIEIANHAEVGALSDEEKSIINLAKENFDSVPCSACEYCQPCYFNVKIPEILEIYNDHFVFEDKNAKAWYKHLLESDKHAGNCTECGACEKVCPQNISIISKIKKVHEALKE